MSSLKIDAALLSKLSNLETVTLCDPDGVPVGTFTRLHGYCGPLISDEESERRLADTSKPRHTTDQVLERLMQLEKDNP